MTYRTRRTSDQGQRANEVVHLTTDDINSERMVIRVEQGSCGRLSAGWSSTDTCHNGMVMATDHALPRAFGFRRQQNNIPWVSLISITVFTLVSWVTLMVYLWESSRHSLYWIAIIYLTVVSAELLFSQRRLILR